MTNADSRPLGSIRQATGINPTWNKPIHRNDDGRPGYAWRNIISPATPRDDWVMVTEARPLTPHWTGGPYYDHAGTLEGTKYDPYLHTAASAQILNDWDHKRQVNG